MDKTVEFRGALLRVARQARKMTQKELAATVGVTQAFVSLLEDEGRIPSVDVVNRIAEVLSFPPSFFAQDDPVIGPGIGEIYNRKRKSISAKELESIYAWVNIKVFNLRALSNAVDWPEHQLPRFSLDINVASEADAAAAVRAKWQMPKGPVRSVSNVLDAAGVLVIPQFIETSDMDGMGVLLTDLPPLVFVNTNIPQDRLRFTLMHEIGHLVLHQSSSIREVSQEIEAEAHRFASAFLMPKQEIKPQLRDLSISKLAQLKRHWRVSMSALLMRAKELGTITPADERQLWRELSRHGWRKREPAQFDVHGESPGVLYEELISLYRSELMYSVERLAKVTHLGISDVRSRVLPSKQNLRIVG